MQWLVSLQEENTQRRLCGDGGRDLSDTATSQLTPKAATDTRSWEVARRESSRTLEGAQRCPLPDFGPLATRSAVL